jgi:hypothetical protein
MLKKIEAEKLEKEEQKRVAEENYRIEMERRKKVEEEEERREELLRVEQVSDLPTATTAQRLCCCIGYFLFLL